MVRRVSGKSRFTRTLLSVGILFSFFAASPELFAAESKKKPTLVGWRGNWTGRFPNANPPIKWSKLSKAMKGLRCQAEKPKDDKPSGVSAYTGSLTEWLVLGPFPAAEDKKEAIDEEFIKDEANCKPKKGEVVKDLRWKKVKVAGSMMNFASIFANDMPDGTPMFWPADAKPRVSRLPESGTAGTLEVKNRPPFFGKPFVAYAHTYVYSPMAATLRFRLRSTLATKMYVNGKLQFSGIGGGELGQATGEFSAELNQGWNRVLCKVRNRIIDNKSYRHFRTWYFDLGVRAVRPYETESEGIAWAALLPGYHVACPFIVGDKIFVMSKPGDLICLRKRDGKVLWIGSTTYYDLLSDKDKQDNPALAEVATKVAPLVKKIEEIHAAYVRQGKLSVESMNTRIKSHDQITRLMGKADKKYAGRPGHHADGTMPTPFSDGKHVYVWSELGIAVCYDLDGKRQWLAMPGVRRCQNGDRTSSPTFADGKMVIYEPGPIYYGKLPKGAPSGHKLVAFDARSGAVAWSTPLDLNSCSSLIPVRIGGEDFVYLSGYVVRGRDGKIVVDNRGGGIPTPIIDGTMYRITKGEGKLPAENIVPVDDKRSRKAVRSAQSSWRKLTRKHGSGGADQIASPLHHEGLFYTVDGRGHLAVGDLKTGELVYQQYLGAGKDWEYKFYYAHDWGWGAVYASPILAGSNIYVFAMNGTTVVFKPGRKYQEVARNKIEDYLLATDGGYHMWRGERGKTPEHFASSPVAEGGYIYIRGGNYLYCIGKTIERK